MDKFGMEDLLNINYTRSYFLYVYMSYITRDLRYWMANVFALALCIPLVNWVNRLKNQA